MVANSEIPPNMAMFQFIVCAVTGRAVGKKQKMKKAKSKQSAMALIAEPQRPSEKRAGGSSSPRKRFAKIQPMETMYELSRADIVRETMAFKATLDPRLMSDMMTPKPKDTQTALRGIFQPGWTFSMLASVPRIGFRKELL